MTKQRNRRGKKSPPPPKDRFDVIDDNIDIVAQLQRQRKRQEEQSAAAADTAAADAAAAVPLLAANAKCRDNQRTCPSQQHQNQKNNGHFQYDPVKKRYFPKSIFTSHGNYDACANGIRKRIQGSAEDVMVEGRNKIIDKQNLLLRWSGNGYVSFKDVRRIVFRGACLSMIPNSDAITSSPSLQQHGGTTTKTKHTKDRDDTKAFCTERTSLLLACSLQYCASTHRRNALVSTMIGPIVLARRARIIPVVSTLEDIRKGTKQMFNHYSPINVNKCKSQRKIRSYSAWEVDSQKHKTTTAHHGVDAVVVQSEKWFSILQPLQRHIDQQMYVRLYSRPFHIVISCRFAYVQI